jgi:hypothetical protein
LDRAPQISVAAARDLIVIQVSVAGADGLVINAGGVTVRHLKLDGPTAADNGISVHAGGATIEDVQVTGWGAGIISQLETVGAHGVLVCG